MENYREKLRCLQQMIDRSQYLVCLMGVWVSSECGCTNYRDEKDSYKIEQKYGYSPDEMFNTGFFHTRPQRFYEFYKNDTPERVIEKMLNNLETKITDAYKTRAKEIGMSIDDVLTLASIIQAEAGDPKQMKTVSSVLHNRLKSKSHPKLECDVTIFYLEQDVQPYLTEDKDRFNSYYNYKCTGLPEGPICNPGMDAIEAALYPKQTEYFYFATDKAGKYYYAKTLEEHNQNWAAIKKVNASLETSAQTNA